MCFITCQSRRPTPYATGTCPQWTSTYPYDPSAECVLPYTYGHQAPSPGRGSNHRKVVAVAVGLSSCGCPGLESSYRADNASGRRRHRTPAGHGGAAGRRPPQSVSRSAPTRPGPALLCSSQSTGCLAFAAAHAQARVRVAESTSAAPAIPPCTVPRAAATARGLQPSPGAACRLLLAANVKSRIEHPGCCVGSPLSCRLPATTRQRRLRCARRQASRGRQHHQRAPHQSPAATRPADPSAEGEPTSQHVGWGLIGPCSALWGLWL